MTSHARLWHFHGGLRLPEHKSESTTLPIATLALPAQLVLPLVQHIGVAAEPLVKVGDRVLKGQLIARAGNNISAPVHASVPASSAPSNHAPYRILPACP